jgi:hypothetical protein
MLSSFAFNFNLHHYNMASSSFTMEEVMTASTVTSTFEAGAYTRPLSGSTSALIEG